MAGLQGRQSPAVEAYYQLRHRIAAAPSGCPGGIGEALAGGHGQQRFGMRHPRGRLALGATDVRQPRVLDGRKRT
jgi:hypothetical protein